jgi:hypothetical protein
MCAINDDAVFIESKNTFDNRKSGSKYKTFRHFVSCKDECFLKAQN